MTERDVCEVSTIPKSRPILFNGEMVRALLDGRKTQTRRVVKHKRIVSPDEFRVNNGAQWRWFSGPKNNGLIRCPYGSTGDRLWVRETWTVWHKNRANTEFDEALKDAREKNSFAGVSYRASARELTKARYAWWRPSIYMPRWASRITLEVVSVRVERVQDITIDDIRSEGIRRGHVLLKFIELWDSINAKRGFGWSENPWVWVVGLKRVPEVTQ